MIGASRVGARRDDDDRFESYMDCLADRGLTGDHVFWSLMEALSTNELRTSGRPDSIFESLSLPPERLIELHQAVRSFPDSLEAFRDADGNFVLRNVRGPAKGALDVWMALIAAYPGLLADPTLFRVLARPRVGTVALGRDGRGDLGQGSGSGGASDVWRLETEPGHLVFVDVVSGQFDAVLQVATLEGVLVGEDDDSGGCLNPRLSFEATANEYAIVVMDYYQEGGGRYVVRVTDTEPGEEDTC